MARCGNRLGMERHPLKKLDVDPDALLRLLETPINQSVSAIFTGDLFDESQGLFGRRSYSAHARHLGQSSSADCSAKRQIK